MTSKSGSSFYQQTRSAEKILAVGLGFLGDTVHLIPALWEIKRNYPRVGLHVLTSPVGAEVLRLAPCVDRSWAAALDPARRSLLEQWRLIRALRRERFDAAISLSGADRCLFMTALSGARRRAGCREERWHFWSRWLIGWWMARPAADLPVFEQRRQGLASCGLTLAPARWDLRIPDAAREEATARAPFGAIHFSISASTPLKEWPLDHWIDLARRLLAHDPELRIVATDSGSGRESQRVAAFVAGAASERVTALPAALPIATLAGVLARCRLHVGLDSGVLHLAAALGIRTLALFRQYHDASGWAPRGLEHTVLSVPCRCVTKRRPPCANLGWAECLGRLLPHDVERAALEQLAKQTVLA